MSFLGRALGQMISRFMTNKVANSQSMRKAARATVKGVNSVKKSVVGVCHYE